jgi:hypothetical protein
MPALPGKVFFRIDRPLYLSNAQRRLSLGALRASSWILARSATGSREADLGVFAKLFEDRLEGRL